MDPRVFAPTARFWARGLCLPVCVRLSGGYTMICWDRHDGTIIGYFSPRQVRWLREHVGAVHRALQIDLDL